MKLLHNERKKKLK